MENSLFGRMIVKINTHRHKHTSADTDASLQSSVFSRLPFEFLWVGFFWYSDFPFYFVDHNYNSHFLSLSPWQHFSTSPVCHQLVSPSVYSPCVFPHSLSNCMFGVSMFACHVFCSSLSMLPASPVFQLCSLGLPSSHVCTSFAACVLILSWVELDKLFCSWIIPVLSPAFIAQLVFCGCQLHLIKLPTVFLTNCSGLLRLGPFGLEHSTFI